MAAKGYCLLARMVLCELVAGWAFGRLVLGRWLVFAGLSLLVLERRCELC